MAAAIVYRPRLAGLEELLKLRDEPCAEVIIDLTKQAQYFASLDHRLIENHQRHKRTSHLNHVPSDGKGSKRQSTFRYGTVKETIILAIHVFEEIGIIWQPVTLTWAVTTLRCLLVLFRSFKIERIALLGSSTP